MKDSLKQNIKSSIFYDLIKYIRDRREIILWENKGKPLTLPSCLKHKTIIRHGHQFSLKILIETGTYLGETLWATRKLFDKIFSIEVDRDLFQMGKIRFAKFPHINIIHGDSGKILGNLLPQINEACLFWLDGHYSGGITGKATLETPITDELNHIFNHHIKGHVILIDDARCFNGQCGYPTISDLHNFVLHTNPNFIFKVEDDIIRIYQSP